VKRGRGEPEEEEMCYIATVTFSINFPHNSRGGGGGGGHDISSKQEKIKKISRFHTKKKIKINISIRNNCLFRVTIEKIRSEVHSDFKFLYVKFQS
jgi:hypothetical protein